MCGTVMSTALPATKKHSMKWPLMWARYTKDSVYEMQEDLNN
jgi:hypothetical protein